MGATTKIGLIAIAVTVIGGGGVAFVQAQDGSAAAAAQAAPAGKSTGTNFGMGAGIQPIAFPHDIHAQTNRIDCAYCHFSAERSVDAGIPPVSTCMGCHAPGKVNVQSEAGQAEIAKLQEIWANGETIPWVRIHKVADHVKYPHMRHIQAGLDCTQCHGQIQEMGVLQEPDPTWGNGKMGWCISCHVENDVSRDCTVCHY
ncbi:MAG: cytochrome c3 family protein [Longimicrobiales bacterium]|nr:cytochrome c3 family protein [Longimicrobiales bacterium]